jgi:PIN domain nuclease of toxin-antitoxin system
LKFLIDTHAWLWSLESPEELGREAIAILKNPRNVILFSAVSAWEIAIKVSLRKLELPEPPAEYLRSRLSEESYTELPVEVKHAIKVPDLPAIHRDPFDRLLIAQAIVENVPLLTADRQLEKYPAQFIWAGLP